MSIARTHMTVFVVRLAAGVMLGASPWIGSCSSSDSSAFVSGTVVDTDGPIAGAAVRVRATDNVTVSAADGTFMLTAVTEGDEIEVTAWSDGYYITGEMVTPPASGIELNLRRHHTTDHPDYEWTSPVPGSSDFACGNHHPTIVSQWSNNAHGKAIGNARFFSLYNGTDVSGTVDTGVGYRKDFPDTAGNCANCHAPAAAVDGYVTTDMNAVRGTITAGIHCDYCHKVGGVYLDPVTQSVYPNAPGVQSQRVLRPPPGENIFFGPYADVPDPDTHAPAMSESGFCAPCHQFSMWGTPIYESYAEWLGSPYATDGVTCQTCHMPPNGDTYFALLEAGAREHPPERIPSHLDLGGQDVEFMRGSATMDVSARSNGDHLEVTVAVTNSGAGHHIPTDHPGRHLILVVTATDASGRLLTQFDGPTVPSWGGAEAGLPGTAFAKVLRDAENGRFPVVSYWKRSVIVTDNRIPAMATDTSNYVFARATGSGQVEVAARLVFRRLYQDLADQYGWDVPDVVLAKTTRTVSP